MRERRGNFLFQLFFKLTNTNGICLPFGVYYKNHNPDLFLRLHELGHVKQMQREGVLIFLIKYAFQLRMEWAKRPYEIEADNYAFVRFKAKSLQLHTAIMTDSEYIEFLLGE